MTRVDGTAARWVTAVARQHTPLFLSLLVSGQDPSLVAARTGLGVGFEAIRRDGLALQYDARELELARAAIAARRAVEGLAFFDDFAQRCTASCERLLALAARLGAQADTTARARVEAYVRAAIEHAAFLQTMVLTQFELEDVLRETLLERVGDESEDVVAATASALKLALEPTHEVLNLADMLELGAHVQQTVPDWDRWADLHPADLTVRIANEQPDIWARIRAYEDRYGWMGRMYYAGRPIAAADIVIRLQNILGDDCAARAAAIAENRDQSLRAREEAIARLGGDAEVAWLADVVSRYMHLRSFRLDVFFIAHERLVDALDEVARGVGLVGHDEAIQLGWDELLGAAADGSAGAGLRVRAIERSGGFSFRAAGGQIEWTASAPPRSSALVTALADGDLLEGVIACSGHARGTVRVVLDEASMLAMRRGEVLVTTMTMPSLMLAVEKAGAIVTDEGGMLCHAAIVSRELNIPCVIATGDATRRLRSGDVVEVNASEGLVRRCSVDT